ncbi:MAG TPA: hypothetical protein VJU16_04980 [Planctomycetota bacterium]|nr:hypothetical protein [Planctomycetota bacterium]
MRFALNLIFLLGAFLVGHGREVVGQVLMLSGVFLTLAIKFLDAWPRERRHP